LPALLFTAAAAWRLARFNLEPSGTNDFSGMPTPAAGIFIASLPLILFYNYFNIAEILINRWALYAMILILAYLMISRIPFLAMKFEDRSVKNNLPKIALAVIAIIAAIFLEWLAIPVVFIIYIIISLSIKKERK
jgi:CDP-diacylglycerol--serine O-phosphatidyltransferase